ncbi:putative estradiol 17 beta-dehydrogenase [Xylariaceae sp. FL0255]|nr:putative estradiol 17 beta-dehydrogenase [Xylariaceae sp. FL0255]
MSYKQFEWTQFFPPKPKFTIDDVPDSQGKVYIVTGGNSGMGLDLARILYSKHKGTKAIEEIKKLELASKGKLVFLHLELADLRNVQVAARGFIEQEAGVNGKEQLHGLLNNAGIMTEPYTKTAQGCGEAIGVNCIGTFLFTKLLTPTLVATAKTSPPDIVRIIWLSSFGLESFALRGGMIDMNNIDFQNPTIPGIKRYGPSEQGTKLARHQGGVLKLVAGRILYSAFSPDITTELDWSTKWVIPFGRIANLRPDLPQATLCTKEGGTDFARIFWEWNEAQVKDYLLN